MHNEIPLKVTAYVDAGVAPLVAALNTLPGLITLDSCEGYVGSAHVYFVHEPEPAALPEVVADLAAVLRAADLCDGLAVSVEYWGSNERPRGLLRLSSPHVAAAARAIERWAISRATAATASLPGGDS